MLKKILQNSLIITTSILFCLLLFEVGFRLVAEKPQTVSIQDLSTAPTFKKDHKNIEIKGSPDEALYLQTPSGMRIRKNTRAVIRDHWLSNKDIEIKTNSLGYRYQELEKKRESDFRILVLGDSITFGDYVPYEQTYTHIVESYLKENSTGRLAGKNIQVINAGIGSVDLQNEFAILMETGLSTEPDVVLIGLYLNDAYSSLRLNITALPFVVKKSYFLTFLVNRFEIVRSLFVLNPSDEDKKKALEEAQERFRQENKLSNENWVSSASGLNGLIYSVFLDFGYAWSQSFWDKIEGILTLMKEVSVSNNFELAVVLLPVSVQVQSEVFDNRPQQYFETTMKKLGLKHWDLFLGLRNKFLKDRRNVFYDHCHFKPEGNEHIGLEIAQFLLKEVI